MAEFSAIGWTDGTFNPWIGCDEVGEGCVFCYAREEDKRRQWGVTKVEADANRAAGIAPHWGIGAPRYRTSVANWRNPIIWNEKAKAAGRPMKVFCASLADVFDNQVPAQWREDLFQLWRVTPWLRWIIVTKRVSNIRKMLPADWGETGYPNVGLVVTTVDQEEFDRDAPRLFKIPAAWHGFSLEPQLDRIIIPAWVANHSRSVWLITGGESRQRGVLDDHGKPRDTRPYDISWARGIITAAGLADNIYAYVKQTGEHPVGLPEPRDGMGKDPLAWPEWMRVHDFPPELLR